MFLDLIKKRRSVYPIQFNQQPILKEEVNQILEAANWAPSHRRTEPWRFKIFHSEKSRIQLSNFLKETYIKVTPNFSTTKAEKIAEKPLQSQCVIAIMLQRDLKETLPEWEEVAAVAMAVQNMWLMATQLEIGGYWSSPSLIKYFENLIQLNEGEKCLGFFYLGRYDHELIALERKIALEEKVVWM